ncbi:hypothetical protein K505DRAFT_73807 [Melanomma pulvis-pyrius CBS 109.77]|uniref:Hydrophobin n=1 Tax=Melanomma pulvis-pyrius CBS 109.77 TaxID=1314802 RepID=A0A6A6XRN9_9PLEO|nr:hypothetical protein K505DRAFT_73807 [Melanomma pulvis-pyrius CBS 109.77]
MFSKLAVITLFLTGSYAITPHRRYWHTPSPTLITSLPTTIPTPTLSLLDQCVDKSAANYVSCVAGTEGFSTGYPPLPTGVRTPPINPHYPARMRRGYRAVDDTAAASNTGNLAMCCVSNPCDFKIQNESLVALTDVPCWTVDQLALPTAWSMSSSWAAPPRPTSMRSYPMTVDKAHVLVEKNSQAAQGS